MNKKASSVVDYLIAIIIGFVLLVILIAAITGKIRTWTSGTHSCEYYQGRCSPVGCHAEFEEIFSDGVCKPATETCCVPKSLNAAEDTHLFDLLNYNLQSSESQLLDARKSVFFIPPPNDCEESRIKLGNGAVIRVNPAVLATQGNKLSFEVTLANQDFETNNINLYWLFAPWDGESALSTDTYRNLDPRSGTLSALNVPAATRVKYTGAQALVLVQLPTFQDPAPAPSNANLYLGIEGRQEGGDLVADGFYFTIHFETCT
ncbi:MAG: hypothetical protein H6502_02025 [Candidatus Woesearchaeota archaeon]|nr:MAG: hypothetical protein H6502_02025 [Candidatus Woesearchaeota archaeon]